DGPALVSRVVRDGFRFALAVDEDLVLLEMEHRPEIARDARRAGAGERGVVGEDLPRPRRDGHRIGVAGHDALPGVHLPELAGELAQLRHVLVAELRPE